MVPGPGHTEPWDGRPCCPSSSILGPSSSGVQTHLFGEPCEEVPATQEVQNEIELALSLEGWGEGKRQWWSQLGLAARPAPHPCSLGLPGGRLAMYGEDSSPEARAKAGREGGTQEGLQSHHSAASPQMGGSHRPGCLSPSWSAHGHALAGGERGLSSLATPAKKGSLCLLLLTFHGSAQGWALGALPNTLAPSPTVLHRAIQAASLSNPFLCVPSALAPRVPPGIFTSPLPIWRKNPQCQSGAGESSHLGNYL